MDRICLIKMDYQSEAEEQEIVRIQTGQDDSETISLAVRMVRETRTHADIKLGASIRAAIDMVDLFAGMQRLADQPDQNILIAARMALSNKIWLNEMSRKTADEIIEEIWNHLKECYKTSSGNPEGSPGGNFNPEDHKKRLNEARDAQKNIECFIKIEF